MDGFEEDWEFFEKCRTCRKTGQLRSATDEIEKDLTLIKMLHTCAAISISELDELPDQICTNCCDELERAYKFVAKCKESERNIQNYIEQLMEQEQNEDFLRSLEKPFKNKRTIGYYKLKVKKYLRIEKLKYKRLQEAINMPLADRLISFANLAGTANSANRFEVNSDLDPLDIKENFLNQDSSDILLYKDCIKSEPLDLEDEDDGLVSNKEDLLTVAVANLPTDQTASVPTEEHENLPTLERKKLTTPEQGHFPTPEQGHFPTPEQGHFSTPEQGHFSTPEQGHFSTPEQGHFPTPEQEYLPTTKLETLLTTSTTTTSASLPTVQQENLQTPQENASKKIKTRKKPNLLKKSVVLTSKKLPTTAEPDYYVLYSNTEQSIPPPAPPPPPAILSTSSLIDGAQKLLASNSVFTKNTSDLSKTTPDLSKTTPDQSKPPQNLIQVEYIDSAKKLLTIKSPELLANNTVFIKNEIHQREYDDLPAAKKLRTTNREKNDEIKMEVNNTTEEEVNSEPPDLVLLENGGTNTLVRDFNNILANLRQNSAVLPTAQPETSANSGQTQLPSLVMINNGASNNFMAANWPINDSSQVATTANLPTTTNWSGYVSVPQAQVPNLVMIQSTAGGNHTMLTTTANLPVNTASVAAGQQQIPNLVMIKPPDSTKYKSIVLPSLANLPTTAKTPATAVSTAQLPNLVMIKPPGETAKFKTTANLPTTATNLPTTPTGAAPQLPNLIMYKPVDNNNKRGDSTILPATANLPTTPSDIPNLVILPTADRSKLPKLLEGKLITNLSPSTAADNAIVIDSDEEEQSTAIVIDSDDETHRQQDGGGTEGKFKKLECDICGKMIKAENLRRHRDTVHFKIRLYPCDLCDKTFSERCGMQIHRRLHTGERPYPCPKCEKRFTCRTNQNYHMKRHLNEENRANQPRRKPLPQVPHKCEVCNRVFTTAFGYKQHYHKKHILGMRRTNRKNFQCDRCSKRFLKSWDLRLHLHSHTGERPFCCEYCGNKFATSNTLKKHITIIHNTTEKLYTCQVCQKRFATAAYLKNHSRIHQNLPLSFKCLICPLAFNNPRCLKRHVKRHEKIKK